MYIEFAKSMQYLQQNIHNLVVHARHCLLHHLFINFTAKPRHVIPGRFDIAIGNCDASHRGTAIVHLYPEILHKYPREAGVAKSAHSGIETGDPSSSSDDDWNDV
jgi:hypothetical protein